MERGKREIPFKFNFKMCYNYKFLNYTVTKTVTFRGKLEEIVALVDLNLHATVPEEKWKKERRIRERKL